MGAEISDHFKSRKPSDIRLAQLKFDERNDDIKEINVSIGNVSLPMHPAMQKRMLNLGASPFKNGVVGYSSSAGYEETRKAFLNIISASGFKTENLHCHITDGGSAAMELVILGTCGNPGKDEKPLLIMDAAYTNYVAMAERTGRKTVSVTRHLGADGKFALPEIDEIEDAIKKHKPAAMLVIPYDNPTGHFYDHKTMVALAELCVKYNLWMISDEAYRELHYVDHDTVSIWGLNIPGLKGRRISIESASKVWNACGLRIGAVVSDNEEYVQRSIAEYTANLSPNSIGQYIFGALAHESHSDLNKWFAEQRKYYHGMLEKFTQGMKNELPGIIVSSPDAAIYSVVDVRNIARPGFDSLDFVMFCASEGKIKMDGEFYTLLVSPMKGFYNTKENNPGTTQMRIAYVESPENMKLVPKLFADLFKEYEERR